MKQAGGVLGETEQYSSAQPSLKRNPHIKTLRNKSVAARKGTSHRSAKLLIFKYVFRQTVVV